MDSTPEVLKAAEPIAATFTHTTAVQEQNASLPRCYPYCRGKPVLDGDPGSLGWVLSNSGTTMYFLGAGAFVIPGVLYLATLQAGCEVEIPE